MGGGAVSLGTVGVRFMRIKWGQSASERLEWGQSASVRLEWGQSASVRL